MTELRFWSHASQKHHLVTRRSKRPIRNFRPWDAQNGLKMPQGDHWRKGPKRNTLSLSKFSILTHLCISVAECHSGASDSLRNFTLMVPNVSLQDFLPLFAASRPEMTNRSFWPSCDQMVLLTGVRPKSMFGLFDHCATKKGLKNPRLMAG